MKLGTYKYLMYTISVFEIFYSILDILVSPIIHSYGSAFLVLAKDSEYISKDILLILDAIYCGSFGSSMGFFAIHFVYRYFVASGSKLIKSFNDFQAIFWFSIPISFGIIWGSVSYFLCGPNITTDQYIRNNILEAFDLQISDIIYIGPYFYPKDENGVHYIDLNHVSAVLINWALLTISFITIITFGLKCYFKITKLVRNSRLSCKYQKIQTQLFYALVTQTMIPIILMHLPVSTMFLFTFFSKDIGMLSDIVTITISLFPAIDPLPTLFIVQEYRKTIFGFFRNLIWRVLEPQNWFFVSRTSQQLSNNDINF
ncbi:unnamed protein product [Caenorhabditis angaria]|uniref:Serpentine receptor class r-10 n=1 Tax=Caenorhabditis angaria TaxID=860376 RepID=A0A9P1N9G3_9PELO|nr:unnamed protein product [Caenorhabditis angaria]